MNCRVEKLTSIMIYMYPVNFSKEVHYVCDPCFISYWIEKQRPSKDQKQKESAMSWPAWPPHVRFILSFS